MTRKHAKYSAMQRVYRSMIYESINPYDAGYFYVLHSSIIIQLTNKICIYISRQNGKQCGSWSVSFLKAG